MYNERPDDYRPPLTKEEHEVENEILTEWAKEAGGNIPDQFSSVRQMLRAVSKVIARRTPALSALLLIGCSSGPHIETRSIAVMEDAQGFCTSVFVRVEAPALIPTEQIAHILWDGARTNSAFLSEEQRGTREFLFSDRQTLMRRSNHESANEANKELDLVVQEVSSSIPELPPVIEECPKTGTLGICTVDGADGRAVWATTKRYYATPDKDSCLGLWKP